jgi:predicted Zn-dependent protease with MMP-like domain
MIEIDEEKFGEFIEAGIAAIPPLYQKHLQNVAFIVEDNPTPAQREKLGLACNQTLLGLYEGIPLPQRGGATKLLPDKITIFKSPILAASPSAKAVKEQVRHTIWHEVAHYYGLDHQRIHQLDGTSSKTSRG